MNRQLKKGVYRHFKGNCYLVLDVAEHTETGEKYVVYKALYGEHKVYIRPYEMFMSSVDKKKYPNVTQKNRFELIDTKQLKKILASLTEEERDLLNLK